MKCLNCGHLEKFHDGNAPAMVHPPCDDFEPDHEAQQELAEWQAEQARDRDLDSRMERERERRDDWERYPEEGAS